MPFYKMKCCPLMGTGPPVLIHSYFIKLAIPVLIPYEQIE
jgi:hypothetical protein